MNWFNKAFAFVFSPRTGAGGIVSPQRPATGESIHPEPILSQGAPVQKKISRERMDRALGPDVIRAACRSGKGVFAPCRRKSIKTRVAELIAAKWDVEISCLSPVERLSPGELTSSQIGRLLGDDPRIRAALHQVEHQDCDYGTHWKWNGRDTLYNPWGILRIVRGLCRRGFCHQADLVARAAGISSHLKPRKKFWWEDL
jgi:hypothetical protein